MPLTYMQEMALYDERGRCRCPLCGKYRRRSDIPDQPASVTVGNSEVRVTVHVAPGCRECVEPMPC